MAKRQQLTSIRTIAEAAEVSRNTVSLALRGSDRVKAETRRRVRAIAERLGYRPNLLARSLVHGHTGLIGLLVARPTDPHMPQLIQAIQNEALAKDRGLLFAQHRNEPSRVRKQVELFVARRVDGLIIAPPDPAPPADVWAPIVATNTRAVFLRAAPDTPGAVVGVSEGQAGRLAVRRLAEMHHRMLAVVAPAHDPLGRAPLHEVLRSVEDRHLPTAAKWQAIDSIEGGRRCASYYLSASQKPSAVICLSVAMAAGFVQKLCATGVRIPADLSVVAVGDSELAEAAAVTITTLRAPGDEMGRLAASILMDAGSSTPADTILDWQWIDRDSLAPLP